MRSQAIVDSRLSIALNLDHTLRANSLFLANPARRAHLANQLLLYDQVVIPTKDFCIVPILVHWLGLKDFERILTANAIAFLHRPSLLGYAGNGNGISEFVIQPGERRPFEWWQEATFGDMPQAIEIQLRYLCPSIGAKKRSKLVDLIVDHSRIVEYDNDLFMKSIVHESYTDIMQSEELSAWVSTLSGNPQKLNLTGLPGVGPDQLKVSNADEITGPSDVVLRVAEINMTLLMGMQITDSDVYVPRGSEILLTSKLRRAKVAPSAIDNFCSLLDLERVPNPGFSVAAGERTLGDIWRIRQKRASKRFRTWLRSRDTGNARELERLYVSSLGKKSFYEKLPTQTLRFVVTKAADLIQPGVGTSIGAIDSLFVEKWLQGYTPKLFLDELRSLGDQQQTRN